MPTLDEIGIALKNADAAGDYDAASKLALAYQQMSGPQPEGMLASFARPIASNIIPALGTAAGGALGAMGGAAIGIGGGPVAVATGIAGDLAGGMAGGTIARRGQNYLLGPQRVQEMEAQEAANARANPFASKMGGFIGALPAFIGGGLPKPKPVDGVVRALTRGEHVANAAIGGGRLGGSQAVQNIVEESPDVEGMDTQEKVKYVADSMAQNAVALGATGLIPGGATLLKAVGVKAPSDAAAMAVANAVYNTAIHGQEFNPTEIIKETGAEAPAFMIMNAFGHGMHARNKRATEKALERMKDGAGDIVDEGVGETRFDPNHPNAVAPDPNARPYEQEYQRVGIGQNVLPPVEPVVPPVEPPVAAPAMEPTAQQKAADALRRKDAANPQVQMAATAFEAADAAEPFAPNTAALIKQMGIDAEGRAIHAEETKPVEPPKIEPPEAKEQPVIPEEVEQLGEVGNKPPVIEPIETPASSKSRLGKGLAELTQNPATKPDALIHDVNDPITPAERIAHHERELANPNLPPEIAEAHTTLRDEARAGEAEPPSQQRDTSKPEQMTPDEFGITEFEPARYPPSNERKRFGPFGIDSPSATPEAIAKLKAEQKEYRDSQKRAKQRTETSNKFWHLIEQSVVDKKPVSSVALEWRFPGGIPEGYAKEGDLYVYRGDAPPHQASVSPNTTPETIADRIRRRVGEASFKAWSPEDIAKAEAYNKSGNLADIADMPKTKQQAAHIAYLEGHAESAIRQQRAESKEEHRIANEEARQRKAEAQSDYVKEEAKKAVVDDAEFKDATHAEEEGYQKERKGPSGHMPRNELHRVIDDFKRKVRGMYKVDVVDLSQVDSDPRFKGARDHFEKQGHSLSDVDAWVSHKDKTIHIIAEKMPSEAQVRRVLIHEAIGHVGVNGVATASERGRIASIIERVDPELARRVMRDYKTAKGSRLYQDELLAKFSETYKSADPANYKKLGALKGAWDEIKRIVQAIIKRLGGDPRAFDDVALHNFYTSAVESAKEGRRAKSGEYNSKSASLTPAQRIQDAAYLKAVEAGDTETAQKMVDQAAKMAGYEIYYRAGDASESGVKPWASFTPDESTAQAYTDNPGFGGGTVRRVAVKTGDVVDATKGLKVLADRIGMDAQDWQDNGWMYPWEESKKVRDAIKAEGIDAVKYTDDFPEGATTVVFTNEQPGGSVKSADPITIDDQGRIIPLSERFNPKSDDIRASLSNSQRIIEEAAAVHKGEKPADESTGKVIRGIQEGGDRKSPLDAKKLGSAPAGSREEMLQRASEMARSQREQKPVDLHSSFLEVIKSKNGSLASIKEVYEAAKAKDPSLTPERFLKEVKAADNAGTVMLSVWGEPKTLEDAGEFVVRNASGVPAADMMVMPDYQASVSKKTEREKTAKDAAKMVGNAVAKAETSAEKAEGLKKAAEHAAMSTPAKALNFVEDKIEGAKTTTSAMWRDAQTISKKFMALKQVVNHWTGKLQISAIQTHKMHTQMGEELKALKKDRNDKRNILNSAISYYLEEPNSKILLERAAASKGKDRIAAYEMAANLTPAEKSFAESVRKQFDDAFAKGKDMGLLKEGLENYVTHSWLRPILGKGRQFNEFSGSLKRDFDSGKKRTLSSFYEGEQLGYTPSTTDISKIFPRYVHEMNKVVATRELIRDLLTKKGTDGRPLAVLLGGKVMSKKEEAEDKSPLLQVTEPPADSKDAKDQKKKPQTKILPNMKPGVDVLDAEGNIATLDTHDYKKLEHPELQKWKYAGADSAGNPVTMLSEMAIHPEAFTHVNRMTRGSALTRWMNETPVNPAHAALQSSVRTVDAINKGLKQLTLGLSPFHIVQEGTHAIGHRISPFSGIKEVDYTKAENVDAMMHGLMLSHEQHASQWTDGVGGGLLLSHLPFGVGKLAQDISDFTFGMYIPALKLNTYKSALERNMHLYQKELARGDLSTSDVKYATARQINSAYGHLNYADLGRSATGRHISQLLLLAPDFLEARGRFAANAAQGLTGSKVGREQLKAIATLFAAQYFASRIGNALANEGDTKNDLEHMFSVQVGNREYTMRSVPEDIYKMFHDWRRFGKGRISPLASSGIEALFGTNYRGEKVDIPQTTYDLLLKAVPMSLQAIPALRNLSATTRNNPISPWEQFVSTLGLHVGRYSPITEMQKMAFSFQEKNGKPQLGTYPVSVYQPMRYALEDLDIEKATAEFKKLIESKGSAAKVLRGFHESIFRPWTGDLKDDAKFKKELEGDDKLLFSIAEQRRKDVWHRLLKIKESI